MTEMPEKVNITKKWTAGAVVKECLMCACIVLVLIEMDRCLENLYPYMWFDSGKRIIDLWMAFEMRTHALFVWTIPAGFVVWLVMKLAVKKEKPELGILLPALGLYVVILLISLAVDGNISRWANSTQYPFVMLLFLTMQCSTVRGAKRLVRVATDTYIVLLAVNLVFIAFPVLYEIITGWTVDYFIGQYNLVGFPMATGMFYALLDSRINGRSVREVDSVVVPSPKGGDRLKSQRGFPVRLWIYAVLFFVNLYLIGCATNLIMGAVVAVFLLVPFLRKAAEKWNFWAFTGFALAMFAALMWFLVPIMSLKPMEWLATTVLKQDVTLSRRQIMWDDVIKLVYEKPLLGHGLGDKPYIWQDPTWTHEYLMHANNCWLQTLYEGGLVYFSAVLVVFGFIASNIKKLKDRKAAGVTVTMLFALLILQEANIEAWFVWFPVLMFAQLGILVSRRCG